MSTKLLVSGLVVLLAALSVHAGDGPKIDGWKPLGEPSLYNPQNVWNAINGAAEIYLDYGFQELLIQRYKKGNTEIELEVYDQGSGINAFGIFRRERPPTAPVFPIGGEAAIKEPYTCMMFKGTYLARVKATVGELKEPICQEVLEGVAKSLKGEGRPEALAMMPSENRVAGSEGYTPNNYLGITDLPKALHAKFEKCAEETCELFALMEPDIEKAERIWKDLSTKWKHTAGSNYCSLYRDIPYRGPVVVVRKGNRIWGVTGKGDLVELREWLKKTIRLEE